MITLACLKCQVALRLSGEFDEMDFLVGMKSDWYPDRYPCPTGGCGGTMTLTDTIASVDLEKLRVHDLNPQEAFQAMHGMGLPKERECSAELVLKTLVGHLVTSVDIQDLRGSNRSVIHSLTLENGVRLYLGSSPFGAVVYRVAPPRSHVQELEQNG
jgi:hypothetical protein